MTLTEEDDPGPLTLYVTVVLPQQQSQQRQQERKIIQKDNRIILAQFFMI